MAYKNPKMSGTDNQAKISPLPPSSGTAGRSIEQRPNHFLLKMADRPEVQNVSGDGVLLFGKYELGRLLGCGAFAKVYHARDVQSGTSVAIKVISKQKIVREGLVPHIKREIAIMRRLRHPHIVRLFEVLATKAKIYFVMEYVKGGELFAKISTKGKLREDDARRYFQHLISAVRFCHSRGVFHRDLKPENLLLDEHGNVKVSDFGLSAVSEQIQNDGLFHTLCGTPAYVAPEILAKKGYDGRKVDIWSCGVILFVLVAGYLPFNDPNLMEMYKKIYKGQFRCPKFMSPELKRLVQRLLDPNRETRITTEEIIKDAWFCKGGYKDAEFHIDDDDDGWWMKNDLLSCTSELSTNSDEKSSALIITQPPPASLNAFDIISFSSGIDLSGLFDDGKAYAPSQERFISREPAAFIIDKLEELAKTGKFTVKKKNTKIHLEGPKFELAVGAEIFQLTDSLVVVEVKKRGGDRAAYEDFYRTKLRPALRKLVCNDSPHAALSGAA